MIENDEGDDEEEDEVKNVIELSDEDEDDDFQTPPPRSAYSPLIPEWRLMGVGSPWREGALQSI